MEKTTLINGNGRPYEREVPKVRIFGHWNEVAFNNLKQQTGIAFEKNEGWRYIEGQPETWEQFSKIFLAYNFLTHSINNWDGNLIILKLNHNVPLTARLYYEREGQKFIGVE